MIGNSTFFLNNGGIVSLKNDVCVFMKQKGYCVDKRGNVYSQTGRKLLQRTDKEGYHTVSVRIDNLVHRRMCRSIGVHKFVAYIKYGEKLFQKGIQARHLNGNRVDNSWDNIAIGTSSQNQMDIPKDARIKRSLNAAQKTRKLTKEEVLSLRGDRSNGMIYNELMKKYGIAKSTVSYIVNNITYKWVEA